MSNTNKIAAFVTVQVKGQIFSIDVEDKSLRGSTAEITPAPCCGWNPIEESGFGHEFYYRVKLTDGQVFYRESPNCLLYPAAGAVNNSDWQLWLAVKGGKVVLLPCKDVLEVYYELQ